MAAECTRCLSKFPVGKAFLAFWSALISIKIPTMAYTVQLYFGRRAWQLMGKKTWLICTLYGFSTLTLFCGWA